MKGREGNRPTGACPLYYLSFVFLFSFLSFSFSLLSYFLSILFFLSFSSPVFFYPCSGHSGGLLTTPAVTRFYYFALSHLFLVWVYLPTTTSLLALPSLAPDKEKAVLFIDLLWRPFLPRCRCFLSLSFIACT